jgi:hypothetical protein
VGATRATATCTVRRLAPVVLRSVKVQRWPPEEIYGLTPGPSPPKRRTLDTKRGLGRQLLQPGEKDEGEYQGDRARKGKPDPGSKYDKND